MILRWFRAALILLKSDYIQLKDIQGGFFNWPPLKVPAGKQILTLRTFFDGICYVIWHLELLGGGQLKKPPCI